MTRCAGFEPVSGSSFVLVSIILSVRLGNEISSTCDVSSCTMGIEEALCRYDFYKLFYNNFTSELMIHHIVFKKSSIGANNNLLILRTIE